MLYATSQIIHDVAVETDNYVEYACRNMQQQLANTIIDEVSRGERIVSIRNSPIIEEDPNRCAVKMTLTCKIEKLVRCRRCKHRFDFNSGEYIFCKKDNGSCPRSPDFFCADGKEEEDGN